ncbi:MAG: hypothetical protein ACR2K9_01490 [Solirubrobacteraceae bacterium]
MRRAWLAPAVLAAVGAAVYLVADPSSADLAAQQYRAGLFAREGFALWDGQWYGGHHVPGYSVLFPAMGAWLGPRLVAAAAVVLASALCARLATHRVALLFAATALAALPSGRLAFAFGLPFGVGALLALRERRVALAAALGALASLASPVVGLFAALCAVAFALGTPSARRPGIALAAAALIPIAITSIAFPEGGTEPFVASSFWPVLAVTLVTAAALWREHRVVRLGALLYALLLVGAFVVPSPLGGNAARLGPLLAAPLAALAITGTHRRALAGLALAAVLVGWAWLAPVRDVRTAHADPATHAAYFAPLLAHLALTPGPPGRLEIPFTRDHWEAAYVAPRFALARGWERQLDRRFNALFYKPLDPSAYRRWLDALAVRWVALPDSPLDASSNDEAALLRRGVPGLRLAWSSAHWRVWEVQPAAPLARGAARVVAMRGDSVELTGAQPGPTMVQVRFTPYWALATGSGCVRRAPGGWTEIDARRAGPLRLVTRFSLLRIGAHGGRCT